MKNTTDEDMNFRGVTIQAGETIPDADIPEPHRTWLLRHGCTPDEKATTKKKTTKKSAPKWSVSGD